MSSIETYALDEEGKPIPTGTTQPIVTEQQVLHAYSGMQFVVGKNEDGSLAYMVEFDIPTGAGAVKRVTVVLNDDSLRRFREAFAAFDTTQAATQSEGPQGATAPTVVRAPVNRD